MSTQLTVTPDNFHPFVRNVGIISNFIQKKTCFAYDCRMLCILDGNGILVYESHEYITSQYDILIIGPGIPYRVISGNSQTLAVISFDCSYSHAEISRPIPFVYAENFREENIIEKPDFSQLFPHLTDEPIHFKGNNGTATLFRRMHTLYMSDQLSTAYKNMMLSSLLEQIVAIMIENVSFHFSAWDNIAEKIYTYICKNYSSPICLETLSAKFHFHENYINRLLNQNYNTSFHKLLVNLRLSQAVILLESTDLSLNEIADKVGFQNARQLTDNFKKYYHISPTIYRKEHTGYTSLF